MPGVVEDLKNLISMPSVAFPGYPPEPVLRMAAATVDLLRRNGLPDARLLEIPGGYPAVTGDIPAPAGSTDGALSTLTMMSSLHAGKMAGRLTHGQQ